MTPWTTACQASLFMGFPRRGLPFPSPGHLSDPGMELSSQTHVFCITGRFFTSEPPGKLINSKYTSLVQMFLLRFKPYSCLTIHYLLLHVSQTHFGEGNGTPLQYSCLENPVDGGAWWAAVHGVTKSRTWLSNFTFTFHFLALEREIATHSCLENPRDGGAWWADVYGITESDMTEVT